MAGKVSKRHRPAAAATRADRLRNARPAPILLLEAAGREFGRKGFAGASFREIADAAGLSFALIGYHFGSKEELWNSCVEYYRSIGKDALKAYEREMPASRKALGEWLREFLRTGLLLAVENRGWQMSMHAALSNVPSRDSVVLPANDDFVKDLERTFASTSGITRLSPREAQFVYRAIIHMNVAAPYELELITGYTHKSAESLEQQVEFLIALLSKGRGLGRNPRRPAPQKKSLSAHTVSGVARDERSLHLADRRLLKGEKVRERLIEAALKNFALFGFEGASVRTIAKDANVTYPLVIYHFGSKELLWQAAIDKIFRERIERVRALCANFEVNNASQLREVILLLLTGAAARPELRKIFILELFAGSQRYEKVIKPMGADFASAVLGLPERLVEKKVVTRFSASEIQLLIFSAVLYSAALPQVVNLVLGTKTTEQSLNWIADFLTSLLTKGYGLR